MSANLNEAGLSRTGAIADAPESRERAARQRRMLLWRAQKMTFWLLYDNAGALILLNWLTLAAVLAPAWAVARLTGRPELAVATASIAGGFALAGLARLVVALIAQQEFSFRHVVDGIAQDGPRVAALGVLYASGMGTSALGVWFYSRGFLPHVPAIGFVLSGVCFSAGLVVAMSSIYVLPAVVHRRGSMFVAARTSALLAVRHPVISMGLALAAALYAAALATPPGIVLLSVLPLVMLSCCGYELLARHYAGAEDPARTSTIDSAAAMRDEDDVLLNRGVRDFLFPWKI